MGYTKDLEIEDQRTLNINEATILVKSMNIQRSYSTNSF